MARVRSRSVGNDSSAASGDDAIEWRPANAADAPDVLLEALSKFFDSMERTVRDMRGASTTDPRIALVGALVSAFKERGRPPDWIVFSTALDPDVDRSDDTWQSVARVYSKHAVHRHMHLCRQERLPAVCIMRYPGVPGDYATYQLWIVTAPGSGVPGVWPSLVVNRPIRRIALGNGWPIATEQQQSLPLEAQPTPIDASSTTTAALNRHPAQSNQPAESSPEVLADEPHSRPADDPAPATHAPCPASTFSAAEALPRVAADDANVPRPASIPQPASGPVLEPASRSRSKANVDLDLLIALLLSQRNRDRGPSWIWAVVIWALIWLIWPADLRINWSAIFR